jgi:long-chain fatty acid transport protein
MRNFRNGILYRKMVVTVILACCSLNNLQAEGLAITGVGAINRSFGGAGVASPIDAAGSMHWNPAAISGLKQSQVEAGLEILSVDAKLSSRVDALGASGSTNSNAGESPIPNFAAVVKDKNSRLTYGLGFFSAAGVRVNYPSSATNPITAPQPLGLGRLIGEAEILQVVPTVAYQVTDRLALGIAPTLSIARLQADPLFLASPNSNGTYGSGTDADHAFGGGVQIGAYYQATDVLQLGASIKSPQWFQAFDVNSTDANGLPKPEEINVDYPLIASVGMGYTGIQNTIFGMDVRYFDWSNADGFDQSGYDATGALKGFGWDSTFSLASGIQHQLTDALALRAGYNYADNPISNSATMYNVASPLIVEHIASLGMSYKLKQNLVVSLAYLYGFENTITGAINKPGIGDIPGTAVSSSVSAQAVAGSITLLF